MTQAMNLYMPLLMGYLALTFAAGLSVYFVRSNVFTIGSMCHGESGLEECLTRQATRPAPVAINVKEKPAKVFQADPSVISRLKVNLLRQKSKVILG